MKAATVGSHGVGATPISLCRQSIFCLPFSRLYFSFLERRPSPPRLQLRYLTGGGALNGMSCFAHNCSVSGIIESKKRIKAIASSSDVPAWNNNDDDDLPYPNEVLPDGKRVYLDELDVITFLDPPKELIPFDPSSYNPAIYLWKKMEDIPEERRHRLLNLLQPRSSLVSKAWEIAGTRYDDPKLSKKTASDLLSGEGDRLASPLIEFWNCRTSGGPMPLSRINFFKKAIFRSKDGTTCGRLVIESFVGQLATSFSPLYFKVSQVKEVMSTEHPCDFAFHFGDGVSDIPEYPSGFPKPAKHPWPFNDQVVIYVRHLGPGVIVGQAWQEGQDLEKLPQKLCSEILMVKDYSSSRDT